MSLFTSSSSSSPTSSSATPHLSCVSHVDDYHLSTVPHPLHGSHAHCLCWRCVPTRYCLSPHLQPPLMQAENNSAKILQYVFDLKKPFLPRNKTCGQILEEKIWYKLVAKLWRHNGIYQKSILHHWMQISAYTNIISCFLFKNFAEQSYHY